MLTWTLLNVLYSKGPKHYLKSLTEEVASRGSCVNDMDVVAQPLIHKFLCVLSSGPAAASVCLTCELGELLELELSHQSKSRIHVVQRKQIKI